MNAAGDTIDLPALQQLIEARGSPLTLLATDAALPAELRALLTSAPGGQVTMSPGDDGVSLAGATLTLSGTTSDRWPVQGIAGVDLALSDMAIAITSSPTDSTIAASAHASMDLGGAQASPVTIASGNSGAWHVALTADVPGVTPGALIAMVLAFNQPLTIPPQLGVLTESFVLEQSAFALTFVPNTNLDAVLEFAIDAPSATFTLVTGVAALTGLTLAALVTTHSISITITSELEIDHQQVDVSLGLSTSAVITASITAPQGALTVEQIADWIAGDGPSQAGAIASGFGAVGFDGKAFDGAISGISLTFDADTVQLVSLEVHSQLTVASIALDVTLTLPDLTVTGALVPGEQATVSGVLASIGMPTTNLPVDGVIAEVQLAATPATGYYLAELTIDGVATIGSVFDLDEISVLIVHQSGALSGQFNAVATVWDLGELDAGAEYDATSGWTWSVASAPDQTLAIGDILTQLATHLGLSSADVPAPITSLDLTALRISYATASATFSFTCVGDFAIYDTPIEIAPAIVIAAVDATDPSKGYNHSFAGTVAVSWAEFVLGFDSDPTSTTFAAAYAEQPDGPPAIDLKALVTEIAPTLGADVPDGLTIDLKSAKLASISATAGGRNLALGLDLSATISLAELPLIGDRLPSGATIDITDLQVSYASAQLTGDLATTVNALLPQAIQFPATGLAAGAAITATVDLAGTTEVLSLGLAQPAAQPPPAQGATPALASAAGHALSTAAAQPAAPTAKWFDVQKQLGVVQFQRFGVLYENGDLFFAIDAAVTLGPLSMSVAGLGVGTPLTEFDPKFTLTGLGVGYDAPPVVIAGAILNVVPPPADTRFELDGALIVAIPDFGLAAVGSYAVLDDGSASLFIFAQIEAPLGGPAALFVTGLMGGFGFNRALTIPSQDEVLGFPLLALNQPPQPGTNAPPQTLMMVLEVIEGQAPGPDGTSTAWVAPQAGSYWLAVGIEFTSFELVTTRALLIAEFGHDLAFALLGLSTIQLPQAADPDNVNPYVYAELEIEAVLKPLDGYFGLSAILSPNSYVLTPSCKLTGGFAFDIWFGSSEHAGQLVVTLGGYHPAFAAPPYFPQVPRVGLNWAVSDDVSISGGVYFAVTTSCAMTGGELQALFHADDLKASFVATMDVLVSWRPLFFTAQIAVEIDVSYRISVLFCHKTVSLSAGASVNMWGPPTGGRAHVHLWCVSFTVSFGSSGASANDVPLAWEQFAGLLPAPEQTIHLQPVTGLFKTSDTPTTSSSSGKLWIVRATGFRFTTESAIPASHLAYGDTPASEATAAALHTAPGTVAVRPMDIAAVTSVHQLTIRYESPTAPLQPIGDWALDQSSRNTPASLWGAPPAPFTQSPQQPDAAVVADQLVGFAVTAPVPGLGATRGMFAMSELAQEPIDTTAMPLAPGATPSTDYLPQADPTSIGDIAGIAGAAPTRTALYAALAGAGLLAGADDPLTAMAANAQDLFADAPMRQTSPL